MRFIRNHVLVLILLYIPLYSNANIIKCNSNLCLYNIVVQNVDPYTLVVFDIDDTLIVNKTPILQASNLDKLINNIAHKTGYNINTIISMIDYSLSLKGRHLGEGRIVDRILQDIISHIDIIGAKQIALTKVSSGKIEYTNSTYEDRRFNDLKENKIDFSKYYHQVFQNHTIDLSQSKMANPAVYKKGIILTGNMSKGDALENFLYLSKWKPKLILFVDNNLHNIKSVERTMSKLYIDYIGIHYTYIDDNAVIVPIHQIDKYANHVYKKEMWPE